MDLRETFSLSLIGLLSHKLRTLLTMLGIIFGVAAVIAMLSIGEGAKQEVERNKVRGALRQAVLARSQARETLLSQEKNVEQAREAVRIAELNYAAIIRPAFTLGGTGAGVSYNREEYDDVVEWGLTCSPIHEVLIEESVQVSDEEFQRATQRTA
jgi:carbamoylphosphate synthase large subunit